MGQASAELMTPEEAIVWIWERDSEHPRVIGTMFWHEDCIAFSYDRDYLQYGSIPLPGIPFQSDTVLPPAHLHMHACLRDALPDSWGRRILMSQANQTEIAIALESGSDRIGALDFQASPDKGLPEYEPRNTHQESLYDLYEQSQTILDSQATRDTYQFTTAGGARPKATLNMNGKDYLAKFSKPTDTHNVAQAEYIAMELAKRVGITVPESLVFQFTNPHTLLIERFDREQLENTSFVFSDSPQSITTRRFMVSALSLMELSDDLHDHASYEKLAEIIRYKFHDPKNTLHELFRRIIFNVLCSNDDDHARNHAAFWDGSKYTLTPAYDICPRHIRGDAIQSMKINGESRLGHVDNCIHACEAFHLERQEAHEIVEKQIHTILVDWPEVMSMACATEQESNYYWDAMFLRPEAIDT